MILLLIYMLSVNNQGRDVHFCRECGKMYKNLSSLNRHTRYGCGPEKIKCICQFCGKTYSRPDTLMDHVARAHQPATSIFNNGIIQ